MKIWHADHDGQYGFAVGTLREIWFSVRARQTGRPVLTVPVSHEICGQSRRQMERDLGMPAPDSRVTSITEHWGGLWRSTQSRTSPVSLSDMSNNACDDETAARRRALPPMDGRIIAAILKNIFLPLS